MILDSCPQSPCLLPFSLPTTAYITKPVKEECIICSGALSRAALACFPWNVQYGVHTTRCADVRDGDVRLLSLSFCSVHPAAALGLHYVVTPGSEGEKCCI